MREAWAPAFERTSNGGVGALLRVADALAAGKAEINVDAVLSKTGGYSSFTEYGYQHRPDQLFVTKPLPPSSLCRSAPPFRGRFLFGFFENMVFLHA